MKDMKKTNRRPMWTRKGEVDIKEEEEQGGSWREVAETYVPMVPDMRESCSGVL